MELTNYFTTNVRYFNLSRIRKYEKQKSNYILNYSHLSLRSGLYNKIRNVFIYKEKFYDK